jgi:hypothetical protein
LDKVWLKFDVGVYKIWHMFRFENNWRGFGVINVRHMFAFGLPPRLSPLSLSVPLAADGSGAW